MSVLRSALCASTVLLATTMFSGPALAGEGMWLPEQLDDPAVADALRDAGLTLDPTALGDLDAAPLDAIVSLGGCSASFVSPDGLVITNHHCVVGALQHNSTPEDNVLEAGVYAHTREAERWSGPGSRVLVTQGMTDVTETIRASVTRRMSDAEARAAIEDAEKALVAECESTPGLRCTVVVFDGGASYRLIEQLEIRDVRLVYAPPHMVGFYGGDEDNWVWPRHAGDFAFLRAYVAPDGSPAEYAPENVPFRPNSWLRVASAPVDESDFVMVAGYPGRTYRHRLGSEMQFARDNNYPWNIATMDDLLAILDQHIAASEDAEVRLSSFRFSLANFHKNNHGMLDSFATSGAVERALDRDAATRDAVAATGRAGSAALAAFDELETLLDARRVTIERDRLLGWMGWALNLPAAAETAVRWAHEQAKPDTERDAGWQDRDAQRIENSIARMERSFFEPAERELAAYFFRRLDALPAEARVEALEVVFDAHRDADGVLDADAAVAALYDATRLGDAEARMALLDADVAALEADTDPVVQLAVALYPFRQATKTRDDAFAGAELRLRPQVLAAMQAHGAGAGPGYYPDANSTLRVTFGEVAGYTPRDAVTYAPLTTVAGIVEKHTDTEPFDAPDEVLEAIAAEQWGAHVHPRLNTVIVNFASTLDTTGGNSGSATLNANGELCGLLFDGNYEAMASDWLFDPVKTRSIHVSMSYVLWMAEHVHGMTALLDELEIAAP
jgi:V8-like Glu-specific endopeptidase